MNDTLSVFLQWLVILNSVAVILYWSSLTRDAGAGSRRIAIYGAIAGFVLLVVATAAGAELLDALDMSVASAEIAAGLLLITGAALSFFARDPFAADPLSNGGRLLLPVARVALRVATPANLFAAAFFRADRGGDIVLPLVLAMVVTGVVIAAALRWRADVDAKRVPLRELARALSAVLIVLGVDMIADGVNNV